MKLHRIIICLITVITVLVGISYIKELNKKDEENTYQIKKNVLSLEDEITKDSYWCGTFNLLWNDLKDELVKEETKMTNNFKIMENLNNTSFNKNYLNSKAYYKKYGLATSTLKKEVVAALKEKFNTTSSIMEEFPFSDQSEDYFLYTMLLKKFKFKEKFNEFNNDYFKNYQNVKYFGVDENSSEKLYKQVKVLYYSDINNFAIKLVTTSTDEIILAKGIMGNSFLTIYDDIINHSNNYNGKKNLTKKDKLKIPVINFEDQNNLTFLEGKELLLANGEKYTIKKAIQDTSFTLNPQGETIKKTSGDDLNDNAIQSDSRLFYFTNDFVLFLKEKDKKLPYFALNISDIRKYQTEAELINS